MWATQGCGDSSGLTSRHGMMMEMARAEQEERRALLDDTRKMDEELQQRVGRGTPAQIAAKRGEVEALETQAREAEAKLEAPVASARAALDEATEAEASFHDQINRYRPTARCGSDGCGGGCGTCDVDEVCVDLWCQCVPSCDGRTCGPDGCGGLCGSCGEGQYCDEAQTCQAIPGGEQTCAPECRGLPGSRPAAPPRVRDFSGRENPRMLAGHYESLDELQAYHQTLKARIAQHQEALEGSEALQTRRRELQDEIAGIEADIAASTSRTKDLKDVLKTQTRAIKEATDETRPALEEELTRSETFLKETTEALAQHKDKLRTQKDELKNLDRRIKDTQRDANAITAARDKLQAWHQRTSAVASRWEKASAEVERRRQQLGAAEETRNQGLEAHNAPGGLGHALTQAREALQALEAPFFNNEDRPLWDNAGVDTAVSPHPLTLGPHARLEAYAEKLEALLEERREGWEEHPSDEEDIHKEWGEQVRLLETQLLLVRRLVASTRRFLELREAIEAERERI